MVYLFPFSGCTELKFIINLQYLNGENYCYSMYVIFIFKSFWWHNVCFIEKTDEVNQSEKPFLIQPLGGARVGQFEILRSGFTIKNLKHCVKCVQ